jgi:L-iditol 2-dehydrogenase
VAGDAVVVFGGGPIGQSVALVALASGARVHVVEPIAHRRDVAIQLGAEASDGSGAAAQDWCGTDGADVVFDTTAAPVVLDQALALAGAVGRVVLVGLASGAAELSPGPITFKELDVLGSSACDAADFRAAVELVSVHRDAVARLVTHRVRLDELPRALELVAARDPSVLKVVVDLRELTS